MLRQHGNDDRRVFRALTFMDGYGIGRHQGVELTEAVGYKTPVEAGSEFALVKVDVYDTADVPIVDLLIMIVLDLHDLVAGREHPAEFFHFSFAGAACISMFSERASAPPICSRPFRSRLYPTRKRFDAVSRSSSAR
jgi:hypothetical protein